jgi:hypothetical protein
VVRANLKNQYQNLADTTCFSIWQRSLYHDGSTGMVHGTIENHPQITSRDRKIHHDLQ